jgi:hypothetical protein
MEEAERLDRAALESKHNPFGRLHHLGIKCPSKAGSKRLHTGFLKRYSASRPRRPSTMIFG